MNPSGMIIMGRDHEWTPDQSIDFEIIRRKYRHVLEIMTAPMVTRTWLRSTTGKYISHSGKHPWIHVQNWLEVGQQGDMSGHTIQ